MTPFLVTYHFYNEEGISIQTSAKDETEARNTMKLLASSNFINSKKWITKH